MPVTLLKTVDTEKRDQMLADKEAEFAAAKEAIKIRYENRSKAENANVKALAEMQTKELEEVNKELRRLNRSTSWS